MGRNVGKIFYLKFTMVTEMKSYDPFIFPQLQLKNRGVGIPIL